MRIDILTLFPEMCETVLSESIIGRARSEGKVEINCRQIRDYSTDKHHRVDDYIRYGGTMSLGGLCYNDRTMIFATKKSTDEYVDSAIAKNIQHSLKNYKFEGHFRSLRELYDKNELTSVINRIVEDINHKFTIKVLTKDFKSGDLSRSAKNMLRDRENPNDILYRIDKA